jgi:hypothetical protein
MPTGDVTETADEERKTVCATSVYQRAACQVAASHRKFGTEFTEIWPYQTMCFGTAFDSCRLLTLNRRLYLAGEAIGRREMQHYALGAGIAYPR